MAQEILVERLQQLKNNQGSISMKIINAPSSILVLSSNTPIDLCRSLYSKNRLRLGPERQQIGAQRESSEQIGTPQGAKRGVSKQGNSFGNK